jgi:hypothetical protein
VDNNFVCLGSLVLCILKNLGCCGTLLVTKASTAIVVGSFANNGAVNLVNVKKSLKLTILESKKILLATEREKGVNGSLKISMQ